MSNDSGWCGRMRSNLQRRIDEARQSGDLSGLRKSLCVAEQRVAEAELIGWKALEQSWRRDVDRLQAALAVLSAPKLRRAA
jgi:hypothetical protein